MKVGDPIQVYRDFQNRRKKMLEHMTVRRVVVEGKPTGAFHVSIGYEEMDKIGSSLLRKAIMYKAVSEEEDQDLNPITRMEKRRSALFEMHKAGDYSKEGQIYLSSLIEALSNLTKEINKGKNDNARNLSRA